MNDEVTHLTDVAEIESLTAMHVVEGYVWCSKHGEVHSDSLNPYGYVETVPGNDFCKPENHDAIFCDIDRHVALILDPREPIEPMPVRSNPVPLTVRRHTAQSRDIFWHNLYNALPADMSDEDRSKITDELMGVAITHGNKLRRARITTKLREAAEEMEGRSQYPGKESRVGRAVLASWGNLMMDAALEIESFGDDG